MKNARTRKRSTSEKRKRSTSRNKDDDLLIKALNQKVISDKQILIPKDQYEELLSTRRLYKELQSKFYSTEQSYLKLQEDYKNLLSSKPASNSLQNSLSNAPDQQRFYDNLKNSFSDIDQALKVKSRAARKLLTSALRALQDIESDSSVVNNKTKEAFRRLIGCLQDLMSIFSDKGGVEDDPEAENIRLKKEISVLKEKVQGYKDSLNRLQDQTKMMKKRLIDGEGRRNIEEQESRIDLLEQENEILAQHVKSLQATLTEQCQIIGHLKETFQALQLGRTETTTPTPKRTREYSLGFSRTSQEDYLQDEIENLDLEIQQLQQSLQKALSNN